MVSNYQIKYKHEITKAKHQCLGRSHTQAFKHLGLLPKHL